MPRHWEDREYVRTGIGGAGLLAHIGWLLGIIFAVVGVIGDIADETLGLETTSWLLLSITAFVSSIFPAIGWAVAWYLDTTEPKSKKEE